MLMNQELLFYSILHKVLSRAITNGFNPMVFVLLRGFLIPKAADFLSWDIVKCLV